MPTGAIDLLVEQAVIAQGVIPRCGALHRMRLLGVDTFVAVDMDQDEISRRNRVDMEPLLDDYGVLRLLAELPLDVPVRTDALMSSRQRAATRLPRGAAHHADGWITRVARPALSLQLAVVVDTDWKRGLDRASRFASFCPRMVVINGAAVPSFAAVEATFYGVGAVHADGANTSVLVEPEPTVPGFGPISWQVQEEVFAALTLGS
ncbi:hypothetical protein P5V90_21745 [Mycobacteroides abscessus subsp. abscessus]|uniref:hypothetical protein n=1 Tax=Mycobacteroides abscessus TaxID=36809 RepID=UPI000AED3B5D|nr:hypothetical protein [Mycobacteroides abscessus]MDO3169605.1 hypothetical protein [Mycobacteroides abscessus subsp. abscessus]